MGVKAKILFTVTNDLNNDRRMIRICSTLQLAGYDVDLLGFNRKYSKILEDRIFRTTRLQLIFQKGKFSYIEMMLRIFRYILFNNYDIICAIDMDTLPAVYFAAKLKKNKIVFDAHEYFSEVPEVQHRRMTKIIWKKMEDYYIPKIENKYTVSEGLALQMKNLNYGIFQVIKNVPYLVNEIVEKKPDIPVILYQGAINLGRGLHELIDAVEKINAEVWIIGDGDLVKNLTTYISTISWGYKIKFLGKKNVDDLKYYTSQASIGYNVLEPLGLSYQVSLANKFFDYIQAGIPILTNNFNDYKKINEKYEVAVLIDQFSAEAISVALRSLLENKVYYSNLAANCLRARLEYNWEIESIKLLDFYKNI